MSELLNINVSDHTEKKNGLTYLSWAWAWAEVLKIDPQATWEAAEWNGFPATFAPNGTAMVKTFVTIKGHTKQCTLPVMDHRNKAIKDPDTFAINTAIVRCMTKTIALHGLGLYIYAGEDLPEDAGVKAMPALGGFGDELGPDVRNWLEEIAGFAIDMVQAGEVEAAKGKIAEYELDETQNLYMQSCIKDSKIRKALGFVWTKEK